MRNGIAAYVESDLCLDIKRRNVHTAFVQIKHLFKCTHSSLSQFLKETFHSKEKKILSDQTKSNKFVLRDKHSSGILGWI